MPDESPEPPAVPQVRKGQGNMQLSEQEFRERLRQRFYDPAFERLSAQIDAIVQAAWQAYDDYRKSPRTRPAGEGFADPHMPLSGSGSKHGSGSQQRSACRQTRTPDRVFC